MPSLRERAYKALRRSERFFKTDMVYLAKGGFWLTLTQISGLLVSFLTAIVFANFLSKDAYGYYKYLISIIGIVSAFYLTGFGTAIVRATAQKKEYLAKHAFSISLRWSIPMTMISLGGAVFYYIRGNLSLSIGLILIAIFQPFISSASNYVSFLNGRKEYESLSKIQIIRNVLPALFIIISLLLTKSILIIFLVYLITNALTAIGLYGYVHRTHKLNNDQDPVSYHYAKKLSLINFLTLIGMQVDSIFVFHYLGASSLAIYAFASALPDQIMGMLKNVYTLSLPKFSSVDIKTAKSGLVHKTLIFALFSAVITFLYILCAPILFHIFFRQYNDAIVFTQLISLNIILAAIGTLPAVYFDAQAEARKKTLIVTTSNVCKIILMFFLIQVFGIWGIIIAELLSRTISIILMFILIFYEKRDTQFELSLK